MIYNKSVLTAFGGVLLIIIGTAWVGGNAGTAARSGNYEIIRQVISSGGTDGGSTGFMLLGTSGQTAAGQGSSESFNLNQGFWQQTQSGSCDCRPGDPNNDMSINIGDGVYVINYVFKGGPPPMPYPVCSGDPNGDCGVNIGDAVHIINYIFKGGPPPVTCDYWLVGCTEAARTK